MKTVDTGRKKSARISGWQWVALSIAVFVLVLSGCDKQEEAAASPKGVLRIAIGNKTTFDYMYADYFAAKFPELDVQIIPTEGTYGPGKKPLQELTKLIDEEKPDLLFTSSFDYEKLASQGKLYNLSGLIEKDRFDLNNLLPAAVDYLRIKGQGNIYGLAPKFTNSVLFYNKELFDRNHIPYPKERMTWEDLFRLAGRFPAEGGKGERVYGFHMGYMSSPQDLADYIGQAEGLGMMDAEGKKLQMQTDSWKRIYQLVVEGYRSGVLQWKYSPGKTRYDKEDVEAEDLFSAGRTAMTISNEGQLNALRQRGATFEWAMVETPSADPGHTRNPNFYLSPIYSINAQADNVMNAWKVVKYFNGAEAARIEAKTSNDLPVRKAFAQEMDGHSMEPFYPGKYEETAQSSYNENVPSTFIDQYRSVAKQQVDAMLNGEVTVEQGLQRIQEQGQQALDAAYAAEVK
ncbi:extracellular solute-binding protein [Paenibacillus sp. 1_12]|uniref:ABC transporter substrate-binding protein n=1 Tax=Paenibacillus sp. 1_12 TaxID=1566278 RepID=UPI0008E74896|nr:extracellular solute-binding protein [Paenibacillus sp. 1_12]SFM05950.1 extracellular solute-binding protein [Paenibacillus sp. 1_12]